MANDGTLGYDEAAAIIADLVDACAARSGMLPNVDVMLGGTALAARAVRPLSHDVDVYLDSLDDDAVAEVAAEALEIADSARHIQRLHAIRRARGGQDPTD